MVSGKSASAEFAFKGLRVVSYQSPVEDAAMLQLISQELPQQHSSVKVESFLCTFSSV